MNKFRSEFFGTGESMEVSPLVPSKRPKGANAEVGLHTVPVARKESRSADTREADRHRLNQEQVRITHARKRHKVELVNLSGGGAMIRGDFAPRLWDRVDLHLGDNGTVECAVRWIKGDRVGLEFAHETYIDCSLEEKQALLEQVIARNFPNLAVAGEADESRQQEIEDDHQRAEQRHPLIWSGLIHFNYDSSPVRLRNISRNGAQIETGNTLPENAELLLDLGEAGSFFATVTWTCGDQAGLRFHSPFDLACLAMVKPEVTPAKWERPGYLQGSAQDGPWAKEWNRMSVQELGKRVDIRKR